MIYEVNYFWDPPRFDFRPFVLFIILNDLPNSSFMRTILFADDTVLVQSKYYLENNKTWLNMKGQR